VERRKRVTVTTTSGSLSAKLKETSFWRRGGPTEKKRSTKDTKGKPLGIPWVGRKDLLAEVQKASASRKGGRKKVLAPDP